MRLLIHLMVTGHYPSRVPPFGNPWLNAYVRLPTAYRSLSRPSSAISAMASTLRSCSLDLALLRPSPPKTVEAGTELIVLSLLPCAVFKMRIEDSHAYRLWDRSRRRFALRIFKTIQ